MLNNQHHTYSLTLTAPAAEVVRDLMSKRNLEGYSLRVFVSGAGCVGLQYGMALEESVRQEDFVFEHHGVKVVVDEVSINYLTGATIDYIDQPTQSGFMIYNPNVIVGCGCSNASQSGDGPSSNEERRCHGCC